MYASVWRLKLSTSRRLYSHVPVMAEEITRLMEPDDGKVYIDMTFGSGGHTRKLLASNKSIKVIAVDRDPLAYRKAQDLASQVAIKSEELNIKQSVIPIHGRFSTVMEKIHLSGVPYGSVNGVIFDLGASSMQFDDPKRGFAFSSDGPLDMRMDTSNSSDLTAEDVINNLSQEKIATILRLFGEEKKSRKVANAIVDARTLLGRIKTTQELARIIASSRTPSVDSIDRFSHPATRSFQAIRIFVNNELNELNYALSKIWDFLIPAPVTDTNLIKGTRQVSYDFAKACGVIAVLSFHSLEDRIVKHHFSGVDPHAPIVKSLSQHARIRTNCFADLNEIEELNKYKKWIPTQSHVQKPSQEEIILNPRSRSAKLRTAIRLKQTEE